MSLASYQFGRRLRSELRGGVLAQSVHLETCIFRLTGRLDIGPIYVPVTIHIWEDFRIVRQVPPPVFCNTDWMKFGEDWHNSRLGGMCWVLAKEWEDAMNWKEKTALSVIDEGLVWLLNNVRCLVNRHYVAKLEGLTQWKKEWDYWDHGPDGTVEYEREKQSSGVAVSN